MNVGHVSGVWGSATTSLIAPTPTLENFQPAPTIKPLGGSSGLSALSVGSQSALLRAQEENQPRP
jgi:hypothetical protein